MKSVSHDLLGIAVSYSSLSAVYLLSALGEILSWNCGAEHIKGWNSRDITGLNFSNFYDDDERAKGTPASNLACARSRGQYVGEGWRIKLDGSVFRASVASEYLNPINERQPAFIKMVSDISHSYQEKMAMRLEQQALVQKNARLKTDSMLLEDILNRAYCALILCDALTGEIIHINSMATRLACIRDLVLSGNVRNCITSNIPSGLTAFFHRGMIMSNGNILSETLSFRMIESEIKYHIVAEKFSEKSGKKVAMFTVIDVSESYQARLATG